MALNAKTSIAARNRALDAAFDVLDGGFQRIYSAPQPVDVETAIDGSCVLLAELALGTPACAPASGGTKALNAIADDVSANATGVAAWSTFVKSDGTRVHDCSVGVTGANINIENTVSLVAGARVSVSSCTFTMGA